MAFVVHLVVCEFHAIKADNLTHPGLSWARRVWVNIEPGSDARVVRIPSYHPLWAVVHVPEKAQSMGLGSGRAKPGAWEEACWDEFLRALG